jgi:anti-sigma-K factor RskA
MRLTPERRAHLAGAYALGTLRGPARAWVERRLRHDAVLCAEVTGWQERLARWVERLAPAAPRAEVWHALERRIVGPVAVAAPAAPTAPEVRAVDPDAPTVVARPRTSAAPASSLRQRDPLAFWRRTASVALAAALALAIGLGLLLMPPPLPTHTAVFADARGRPVWIVDARLPEGVFAIRALPAAAPPPGKSYELWMLPAGGAPVSLGLLPASGAVELVLGAEQAYRMQTAAGIAVSLEPAGGSPTGQPTGPVVYQAVLTRTAG